MTTLSTAVWVSHDAALAAGLGGSLFKQFALPPAINRLDSDKDRARVLSTSMMSFGPIGLASAVISAGTWFIGRAAIDGRSIDRSTEMMVRVKDGLILGIVGTHVAGMFLDRAIKQAADANEIGVDGMTVSPESSPRAKKLFGAMKAVGMAQMACFIGAMAVTTILSMKAAKSAKWSLISRLLP